MKLLDGATLDISHDDLAKFITEHFSYGALHGLTAVSVDANDGGGFTIKFVSVQGVSAE